jgi:hypothetical protein
MENNNDIDDDEILDDEILDDELQDLDTSWLQDFEASEQEYKDYYTEDLSFIFCHILYINRSNEIEKVKEDKVLLNTLGVLQKEELLAIIKRNSFSNGKKYGLLSILKFNINFDPMYLKTFLKSKKPNIGSSYLHSVSNIDTIPFDKSISMFHDLNDIILLFYEKDKNKLLSSGNHTKKFNVNNNPSNNPSNNTNTNKKTKRNLFKETSS